MIGSTSLQGLLRLCLEKEASDLHLSVGLPPAARIYGEIVTLPFDNLDADTCKSLVFSILNDEQINKFEQEWELDFSLDIPGIGRFRVNVFRERGYIEASLRIVTPQIKTLQELGLSDAAVELTRRPNGLLLITGPTGVGKTTTFNSVLDQINRERRCRIITIEDPIEYIHRHKKSIVLQREIHSDTRSFGNALRHILRQDPDIIGIGEMRDLETISTAITAAETGHLVIATLHTSDAQQTIDRIVDVFPPFQHDQIRIQLANSLQGIISQQLLPTVDKSGRVLSYELLIATPAVRRLIRENKVPQIDTFIQTGSEFGMISMDRSLKTLYQQGRIAYDVALSKVKNPAAFKEL
ncbi:MAG TPA: type IV pilus twitching motility protein PilT [Candidatus Ozemobacteraceae bacterium]|mgnify:CR=1 FL=1|nr:type IV pilus twitching motility protein PilT [Candidatus Ozemobacteraceae bacterium]